MEHGRLDSLIGSYSIPGIDFLPHIPSKIPAKDFVATLALVVRRSNHSAGLIPNLVKSLGSSCGRSIVLVEETHGIRLFLYFAKYQWDLTYFSKLCILKVFVVLLGGPSCLDPCVASISAENFWKSNIQMH